MNKSLLHRTASGRYLVHELVRQFAAEQLAQRPDEETAVYNRYSDYYLATLREHSDDWPTNQQVKEFEAITPEVDNMQQAWDFALEYGKWQQLTQAFDCMSMYYSHTQRIRDAESMCQTIDARVQSLVATASLVSPDSLRLWAKALAGQIGITASDVTALQLFEQSLKVLERPELADQDIRGDRAFVLFGGGRRMVIMNRQDARPLLEQSVEIYRELNRPRGITWGLNRLGQSYTHSGTPESGLIPVKEALLIAQQHGYVGEMALSKIIMGWIYATSGQLDEAERVQREAINLNPGVTLDFILLLQGKYEELYQVVSENLVFSQDIGDTAQEARHHVLLIESLLHLGRYELASQRLAQALLLIRENDSSDNESSLLWMQGRLALLDSSHDEAKAKFVESADIALELQERQCFAWAGLGYAALQEGSLEQARQHLVKALSMGLRIRIYYPLIFTVPGVAMLLAAIGDAARAVEIWTFAQCHPYIANSKWFQDVVGQELDALAASLPPEVAEAARERGRTLDLWEEAAVLLAELEAMDL
jgi:tetratricopeptide (TPR) repeat protein